MSSRFPRVCALFFAVIALLVSGLSLALCYVVPAYCLPFVALSGACVLVACASLDVAIR